MNILVPCDAEPRFMRQIGGQSFRIDGGRVLLDGGFEETPVLIDPDTRSIAGLGDVGGIPRVDASGLLVLPGVVDIHGDSFERQMMPRPGVNFPIDVALSESDRQALANGITTLFHGVTWSWEPGLRGADNARALLTGIERMRARLGADTRFHLRQETYNIDAEAEIAEWIAARRIDVLAFNDHMSLTAEATTRGHKLNQMIERSGLSRDDFLALVERTNNRASEVPESIARLADIATRHGVPLLSHDDTSPEQRRWFRALGCRAAEFPTTRETAEEAVAGGDHVVLGAPNVVRGGSHTGWINATEMVDRGLCTILASDYYYPALLLAPFLLAYRGVTTLERAWRLVSRHPADAMGLSDRGQIDIDRRADLILVDAEDPERPRVVATIVGGKIVHLADPDRMLVA